MQYISPFTTLGVTVENGELDKKDIRRLKRRLLTEFELQGSTTIVLNGQEMDKTAILNIFNQLENPVILDYHLTIFKEKELLAFFESSDLTFFEKEDWANVLFQKEKQEKKQEKKQEGFQKFILPYFATQFNEHLYDAVKFEQLESVKYLSNIAAHFPFDYEGACFKSSYRHLMNEANTLVKLSERRYLQEKFIKPFIAKNKIELLNALPDYFVDVRIRMGDSLEDIALKMNNLYENLSFARLILRRGLQLNTNENVRFQLQYVLDQLNQMPETSWGYGSPTANPRRSLNNIRISWGVLVFVAIFFVRVFINFDENTKYSSQNDINTIISELEKKQAKEVELVNAIQNVDKNDFALNIDNYPTVTLSKDDNPFYDVPTLHPLMRSENAITITKTIINASPWDAIVIVTKDYTTYASYLPPNEEISLQLPIDGHTLHAYAGEDWRADYPLNDDYNGIFKKNHGIISFSNTLEFLEALYIQNGTSLDSKHWKIKITKSGADTDKISLMLDGG